jgi:low affinity Fe/Cu permease
MDTPLGINGLKREKTNGTQDPVSSHRAPVKRQPENSMKEEPKRIGEFFTLFCTQAARLAGSYYAFSAAFAVVFLWLLSGPIFHFSDTWQLVINTGTTIVTFLMVFLIQNTQNRDSQALHLKLDALLLTSPDTKNILIDLEELSQEDLDELKTRLVDLVGDVRKAKQELKENGMIAKKEEGSTQVGEPQPVISTTASIITPPVRECG